MPKIQINATDVENFSRKLQDLTVSDEEAAMLSGIFAVAADAISPSGDGVGTTTLVSLGDEDEKSAAVQVDDAAPPISDQFRQQFRTAFLAEPSNQVAAARPSIIIPAPPPAPGDLRDGR